MVYDDQEAGVGILCGLEGPGDMELKVFGNLFIHKGGGSLRLKKDWIMLVL